MPPSRTDEPSGTAQLEEQVRGADPDRWLATRFIADPLARADVITLYAYDSELARAPRASANPLIAEIRLTWWREALDEIFDGGPVRRHPVAEALAVVVRRHHLPREPLEAMIDARIEALEIEPFDATLAERWADQVGGSAATLAGMILEPKADPRQLQAAGRVWGLVLLHRSGRFADTQVLRAAIDAAAAAIDARLFPAIAHATLARADVSSIGGSALAKRLRLLLAVLRGRI